MSVPDLINIPQVFPRLHPGNQCFILLLPSSLGCIDRLLIISQFLSNLFAGKINHRYRVKLKLSPDNHIQPMGITSDHEFLRPCKQELRFSGTQIL